MIGLAQERHIRDKLVQLDEETVQFELVDPEGASGRPVSPARNRRLYEPKKTHREHVAGCATGRKLSVDAPGALVKTRKKACQSAPNR
jgi:hypothetical protein